VVLVFPPIVVVATLTYPVLAWWLDPTFAAHAAPVLRWLLVGVFVNSLAHVPYALLQAHGRADVTAKLHVFELPLFAAMLVVMVREFGIVGAAVAWTSRVAVDCALLFASAWRLLPEIRSTLVRGGGRVIAAVAIMMIVVFTLAGAMQLVALAVILLLGLIETGRMLRTFAAARIPEDRH
jgi:O-antigen/teichoic acid export membrane protein